MSTLYCCQNNGVLAVITQKVFDEKAKFREVARSFTNNDDPNASANFWYTPKPIFTFCDYEGLKSVVTGTQEDFRELKVGFELSEEISFYVPFSNCAGEVMELYREELEEGEGTSDLRFVTTLREVIEAFGLGKGLDI